MNATKSSFNPWPYAIIGYFSAVIVSIVMFVGWTTRHNVELVRNDYYSDEVLYQKHIDRATLTAQTKSDARIEYNTRENNLIIGLSAQHAGANPTGTVELYRPSESKLDQTTPLKLNSKGLQTIDATNLKPGLWKVRVNWNVNGQDFYSDSRVVVGPKS